MLVFCTDAIGGTVAGVIGVIGIFIFIFIVIVITAYVKRRKKVRLKFIHYPVISMG